VPRLQQECRGRKKTLEAFQEKKIVSPPINIHLKSYILALKSKVGQLCKYVQNWN